MQDNLNIIHAPLTIVLTEEEEEEEVAGFYLAGATRDRSLTSKQTQEAGHGKGWLVGWLCCVAGGVVWRLVSHR